MQEKKYLPTWHDGLSYDEQHLVAWIADNSERIDARYSLLPIRMPGDGFVGRLKFDHITHRFDNYFGNDRYGSDIAYTHGTIVPLAYFVAERVFDAAAEKFFTDYPEYSQVSFGKHMENGIYETHFSMDYKTRLKLFRKILDEKFEELCVADEFFEFHADIEPAYRHRDDYVINARLDLSEKDIYHNLPDILAEKGFPYEPARQVRVKKRSAYKYYKTIPENIFVMGNQHIKYNQNAKELADLFRAAEKRDLSTIKRLAESGIDINSIDSDGTTPLYKYIGDAFSDDENTADTAELSELISYGASPSICGAGFHADIISNVCLIEAIDIVELLMEAGVSPHMYPCIDEPHEFMAETLLERTERWVHGDPNIDEEPWPEYRKILDILQKYA